MDVVLHVRQSGTAMQTYTAQALVDLLELSPHPEGGYFRETFRSSERIQRSATLALLDRAAGTAIYYLLPAGTFSAWHSVRSDEMWHHYDGAPAELHLIDLTGTPTQCPSGAAQSSSDGISPVANGHSAWFFASLRHA